MTTTTIRLPEDLKTRVAAAAKRSGTTAHGFILEAIAEKTQQAELRAAFETDADQRYARLMATGEAIPWSEMRKYLEARVSGSPARSPLPRRLAR